VCDVLIDGRYQQEQNNGVGMYGSANQRVHYLTSRLQNHNFSTVDRKVEIRFDGTQLFLVGVPGMHVSNGFFSAVETTKTDIGVTTTERSLEEAGYECK
jgi:anaerobic ribonucleoside-triphosphate reductase activating protein